MQDENIIEGRNSVREALRSGRSINKIFVLEGKKGKIGGDSRLREIAKEASDAKVPVVAVPQAKLKKLSVTGNHQGIIALAAVKEYADPFEVIAKAKAEKGHASVLILDEIFDGRNLGSMIRSGECGGIDLIVIPERRSAYLDSYVSRESAGALEYIEVARVVNLRTFIDKLKEDDFWIYALDAAADEDYRKVKIMNNYAIIVGNEGKGISLKLKEAADFKVAIPMQGRLNSLNAAVAAAVVLFEFAARRGES